MVDEPDGISESGMSGNPQSDERGKNIVLCLDGTGNQYGENLSNIVKLFRMLEREPGRQVAYYDPGVGTMGDPTYKTAVARKINKVLGLAFGRGLMKNLMEAYAYLMEHYEDGDRVFIFGFSRGAYTARALAAFIKDCGLFERGAENLLPYAIGIFLKKAPRDDASEGEFFKVLSGFRSTYGRLLNRQGDPRYPERKGKPVPNYQLRIHFLGLFDTVKSYGWVKNPVVLRNETKNDSVLNVRHALAIDERRAFFHQLHWKSSNPKRQTCKEVWFPGVHSDVGGGYAESESGLAEIALEWMVHEACALGLKVDPARYGLAMQKQQNERGEWEARPVKKEDEGKYSGPDATAVAHESLTGAWKAAQLLPKGLEPWETSKGRRTIKGEKERTQSEKEDDNPVRIHESVLQRMRAKAEEIKPRAGEKHELYRPPNLPLGLADGIEALPGAELERTIAVEDVWAPKTPAASGT